MTDQSSLTIFAASEAALREALKDAPLDAAEFRHRLGRCALADCRGMCCYDGVPVDDATADALTSLSKERAADFAAIGLSLPDEVVVDSRWRGAVSRKTAVRPFPFRALVENYPEHFEDTACVFHLDDGRCGLQVLAARDGVHPWRYKPLPCWLHPIKIHASAIRLYDEASDPQRYPDYDGYVSRTHCGRTSEGGCPAAEHLDEELRFLGRLLNRDLLAELEEAAPRDR